MFNSRYQAQDLQMGMPVYCSNDEKIGYFRFSMSEPQPPYQVRQILVDRTDGGEGSILVDVEYVESVTGNAIKINLTSEQCDTMPIYTGENTREPDYAPPVPRMSNRDREKEPSRSSMPPRMKGPNRRPHGPSRSPRN
ncbi:hypothetical protein IJT10_01395 [bacterium]|nr:hypothetical protein [bacterium]